MRQKLRQQDGKPESDGSDEAAALSKEVDSGTSGAALAKSSSSAKLASKGKGSRPAWAQSSSQAEQKDDLESKGDEEALMEFAQSLDFNQYIGDIEVKSMMDRLRKRIVELEREVAVDDARELDAEERQRKRDMLTMLGETASLMESQEEERTEDEELNAAAKALLQGDEDMQTIHSRKSVAAMLRTTRQQAASKGKAGDGVMMKTSAANEVGVFPCSLRLCAWMFVM